MHVRTTSSLLSALLLGLLLSIGTACGNSGDDVAVDKNLDAIPDPLESELRKEDWVPEDTLGQDSVNIYVRPSTDQE